MSPKVGFTPNKRALNANMQLTGCIIIVPTLGEAFLITSIWPIILGL
jgi:hypothetical protein